MSQCILRCQSLESNEQAKVVGLPDSLILTAEMHSFSLPLPRIIDKAVKENVKNAFIRIRDAFLEKLMVEKAMPH